MENYQIVIASGKENPEKALLGFVWALSLAATGANVILFFTMNGVVWADKNEGNQNISPSFETISSYWKMLSEFSNVTFEGCTTCVKNYCAKVQICELREGIIDSGLSTAALRASSNTQTLIF